jgi:hypothetical protein
MFSSASKGYKRLKGAQIGPAAEPEIDKKRYLGVVEKKLTEKEEQKRQEAI